MSILVLGEVHVAPSRIAEFKDYFRDLLPDSRAYDGFEKVELYEDTEEEGSILFVEYWVSRAHQERYIAFYEQVDTQFARQALAFVHERDHLLSLNA